MVPEGPSKVNLRTSKQVQHRLEPTGLDRLKRAYESGATLRELAQEFRIHRETAADLLERVGVARRGKGPTAKEMNRAIRLYQAGDSTATIGQRLGYAADTIRNGLLSAGVQMRGPHDWHARG
jgi:hypothetical protein